MRTAGKSKMEQITFETLFVAPAKEKICRDCGKKKPIAEFCKNTCADGRSTFCNTCKNIKAKPYREARKKEKELWSKFSPL